MSQLSKCKEGTDEWWESKFLNFRTFCLAENADVFASMFVNETVKTPTVDGPPEFLYHRFLPLFSLLMTRAKDAVQQAKKFIHGYATDSNTWENIFHPLYFQMANIALAQGSSEHECQEKQKQFKAWHDKASRETLIKFCRYIELFETKFTVPKGALGALFQKLS